MTPSNVRLMVRVLAYLTALVACVHASFAQGWFYPESGTRKVLNGVAFADTERAIAVGDSGVIIQTIDHGQTWMAHSVGVEHCLFGVASADSTTLTVVGEEGFILKTTDGGANWGQQPSGSTATLRGLSFSTANAGIAVGMAGTIIGTTDGGENWIAQVSGTSNHLYAISCPTNTTAIAVGADGTILRTTDGGQHWLRQSIGTTADLRGISFIDSTSGVVVGADCMFRTTNAGATWWQDYCYGGPGFDMSSVSLIDRENGYAVGPHLFDTYHHWITTSPHPLRGVSCTRNAEMIAVGDSGFILCYKYAPPGTCDTPDVPMLASPANGATHIPLSTVYPWMSVTLAWHPVVSATYYQINFDSSLTSIDNHTTFSYDGTQVIISGLWPSTTYYWKVRAFHLCDGYGYGGPTSDWSEVGSFTTDDASMPRPTIQEIKNVPPGSSRFLDSAVIITAVDPKSAYLDFGGVSTMNFYDTTSDGLTPYSGIIIDHDWVSPPAGDVYEIMGVVKAHPWNGNLGTRLLQSLSKRRVGHKNVQFLPPVLPVKIFYSGMYPNGSPNGATGRPYDGMYVEMHNLSVHSVLDRSKGTILLIDGAGNTIPMSRDCGAITTVPAIGSRIDTLRGIVVVEPGPDNNQSYTTYRIAPVDVRDIIAHPSRGVLKGIVFNDPNCDSIWTPDQQGLVGWQVNITGKAQTTVTTNTSGAFRLSGLDSGTYVVTVVPQYGWSSTTPVSGSYMVTLGLNDSIAGLNFGNYYYFGCTVTGSLFDDRNENGMWDSADVPLIGWRVQLSGQVSGSMLTDSLGRYRLSGILPGIVNVRLEVKSGWEQITPSYPDHYSIDIQTYGQTFSGFDFGVHKIPRARIKLWLTVSDHKNSWFSSKTVFFGIRPGATAGIWGVDAGATNIDFSEGEFEIPPPMAGMFDVRFEAPNRGVSGRYGAGSWTDMRDFHSPNQVDTFRVSFRPNELMGGSYPMLLRWSVDSVGTAFSGLAIMIEQETEQIIDMKATGFDSVSDPAVKTVLIVTKSPRMLDGCRRRWQLVSLSDAVSDGRLGALYPTLSSMHAYAYSPGGQSGYRLIDTLTPGRGYWLKYAPLLDTLNTALQVGSRLTDTIDLKAGWNLIGSLSVPVASGSVQSEPAGLIATPFYGYRVGVGYCTVDTIMPGSGFWLKARASGRLIMSSLPLLGDRAVTSMNNSPVRYDPTDLPPPPPFADDESSRQASKPEPTAYSLDQNHPNPFNPSTVIRYSLTDNSWVTLRVFDVLGRGVALLVNEVKQPGGYSVQWDAFDQPSGVYFYRLTAGKFTATRKMLLLR